mmetsp:Transcript_21734/g.76316  ORF Transcript_21734/g.76316 Transcript_21734/m.76316 type:complete len:451 (+) Transcript_21734:2563-3915(+)
MRRDGATHDVRELLQQQPHGRLRLDGLSAGGAQHLASGGNNRVEQAQQRGCLGGDLAHQRRRGTRDRAELANGARRGRVADDARAGVVARGSHRRGIHQRCEQREQVQLDSLLALLEALHNGGRALGVEDVQQVRARLHNRLQHLDGGATHLPARVVVVAEVVLVLVVVVRVLLRVGALVVVAVLVIGVEHEEGHRAVADVLDVRRDLVRAARHDRLERLQAVLAQVVHVVLARVVARVAHGAQQQRHDSLQVAAEAPADDAAHSADRLDVRHLRLGRGRRRLDARQEARHHLLQLRVRNGRRQVAQARRRALAHGRLRVAQKLEHVVQHAGVQRGAHGRAELLEQVRVDVQALKLQRGVGVARGRRDAHTQQLLGARSHDIRRQRLHLLDHSLEADGVDVAQADVAGAIREVRRELRHHVRHRGRRRARHQDGKAADRLGLHVVALVAL